MSVASTSDPVRMNSAIALVFPNIHAWISGVRPNYTHINTAISNHTWRNLVTRENE
jgi:hypothetical protein